MKKLGIGVCQPQAGRRLLFSKNAAKDESNMHDPKRQKARKSDLKIDHVEYFKALTAEVFSLKDRVRNFIKDSSWLTDGEWKESVLRSILKRYLPITIGVGRGFVVGSKERSSQIDLLIYRKTHPVLYQDGDLVFVAPDAVMGIIEVKTTLRWGKLDEDLSKVTKNLRILEHSRRPGQTVELPFPFCGLFYYEGPADCADRLLDAMEKTAMQNGRQMIHVVNVGQSLFITLCDWAWKKSQEFSGPRRRDIRWRADQLDGQGPGCFINDVICRLCPEAAANFPELWAPYPGEPSPKTSERRLTPPS